MKCNYCGKDIPSNARYCPHCKAQIKLPRKKGKHVVKCPRCRQRFDIKVYMGKK